MFESSIKKNLLSAAVASLLGTSAHALPPSASINYTIYVGGGSTQVNAFFWATTQILTPATIDSYTDQSTGKDSPNYRILSGTTSAAFAANGVTIPAADNLLVLYRDASGDLTNAIIPQVGSGSTLAYPTIASIQGATPTTNAYPLPTYKFTAADTNAQIPDWGLSSVEVSLYNFTDNLNGTPTLTSSQLAGIQQIGIYDNLFGVAVTNAVYAPPAGSIDAGHAKTSFTKLEVAGILTGQFSDWSQLSADDGTPLPAGPIALLDRGSGSGTKAAGNQYFLAYPGAVATGGAVTPGSVNASSVNDYTGTQLVLPITAYQDVKEGTNTALVTDLQAANAAGARAIGVLGLENPPAINQVGGQNQYSFVRINGVGIDTGTSNDNINGTVGTSYTNVVTGPYDFFYQNSFNTRSGLLSSATVNGAVASIYLAQFQKPDIAGAHASKAFPNAVPGILLDPKIIGSQVAGVVTGSRYKKSTAPLQPVFDATTTITFGFDPL